MSSLDEFHHIEEVPPKSSRIVHWVILALIVVAIGFYVVQSGMLSAPAPTTQSFPRGL